MQVSSGDQEKRCDVPEIVIAGRSLGYWSKESFEGIKKSPKRVVWERKGDGHGKLRQVKRVRS